MNDGSLNFFDMPTDISWKEMRARIENLEGAQVTNVVAGLIDWWLDFSFRGHRFSVNNPMGEYWFFVEDARCPQEILDVVKGQFRT